MKRLRDFKKEIRQLGYRVKTQKYSTSDIRFLEVLDTDKKFVGGSGANAYPKEHIAKHKKVFELLNENRNKVNNTRF